jgi:acetate kinase
VSEVIVVLNAGSSSLKFSVFSVDDNLLRLIVRGQIEGLGTSPRFKATDLQGRSAPEVFADFAGPFGQREAFAFLLRWLREHYRDGLKVIGVGHRVVHGGGDFLEPMLIDAVVLTRLEKFIPLAPLHQPHNLAAIKSLTQLQPELS